MNNEAGASNRPYRKGLQKAREYRGISQKDTAELLGISSSVLRNYEKGKISAFICQSWNHYPISIIFLSIYLISPEALEEYTNQPDAEQLQQLIKVRQNIISTTLQIALDGSGLSQKDLAKAAGITTSKIKKYIMAKRYRLDDLKKISYALEIDYSKHLDQESQIGLWQSHSGSL